MFKIDDYDRIYYMDVVFSLVLDYQVRNLGNPELSNLADIGPIFSLRSRMLRLSKEIFKCLNTEDQKTAFAGGLAHRFKLPSEFFHLSLPHLSSQMRAIKWLSGFEVQSYYLEISQIFGEAIRMVPADCKEKIEIDVSVFGLKITTPIGGVVCKTIPCDLIERSRVKYLIMDPETDNQLWEIRRGGRLVVSSAVFDLRRYGFGHEIRPLGWGNFVRYEHPHPPLSKMPPLMNMAAVQRKVFQLLDIPWTENERMNAQFSSLFEFEQFVLDEVYKICARIEPTAFDSEHMASAIFAFNRLCGVPGPYLEKAGASLSVTTHIEFDFHFDMTDIPKNWEKTSLREFPQAVNIASDYDCDLYVRRGAGWDMEEFFTSIIPLLPLKGIVYVKGDGDDLLLWVKKDQYEVVEKVLFPLRNGG